MDNRPKTLFVDIDGILLAHVGSPFPHLVPPSSTRLLDGVKEAFHNWISKDYQIILVTGRKESTRPETEAQLRFHGLVWDKLIMGIGGGARILINDSKPHLGEKNATAIAIQVPRNEGLKSTAFIEI